MHAVPEALSGCAGVLPEQVSSVHWFPSLAGVSVLAVTEVTLPAPSH